MTNRQQHRENSRILRDMLALVDCVVPVRVIEFWNSAERSDAETWAAKSHFRASDNRVRVPPMPQFLAPYANHQQRNGYPTLRRLMRATK